MNKLILGLVGGFKITKYSCHSGADPLTGGGAIESRSFDRLRITMKAVMLNLFQHLSVIDPETSSG